ncbi:MAG TPA: type VI secretion system baseplate subunit TssE [Pyrinomonadaceae bacterium]|nr:type VI secretion system baseplate subunit TssE [Pyrinomonadaceae bacterium]
MVQPKPIAGARALLFDRLVDIGDGHEAEQPLRILNENQLKDSVRRELERLLNTRCSIPLHQISEEERSVINYGIPDFSSLSPHNADDHALIASIVGQTISAFEPRLRQVRVEAGPVFSAESALWLNISAELVVGLYSEPVSFPVTLNNKSGSAQLHDSE